MSSLALIVPFFGYTHKIKKFKNWLRENGNKLRESGIKAYSFRCLDINTYLVKSVRIVGKVPKGLVIRLALEAIKSENRDYYICIDGDEQIPYNHVLDLCSQLVKGNSAVLSCRTHEKGIGEHRSAVENFELFLLSQAYGYDLPDGECGLWGFDKDTFGRINLSADGFEIELDFLTELLTKKINFGFIYVDVSKGEGTTVDPDNDKRKLFFLRRKLGFSKDMISLSAEIFEKKIILPKDYKQTISSLNDKEILKCPPCFTGICEDCEHR